MRQSVHRVLTKPMLFQLGRKLALLVTPTPRIVAPALQVHARLVSSLQMVRVLFANRASLELSKTLVTKIHVPHAERASMSLLLARLRAAEHAMPNLTDVAPPVRVFAKLVISLIAVMEPSVQRAQRVKPRDLAMTTLAHDVMAIHMLLLRILPFV